MCLRKVAFVFLGLFLFLLMMELGAYFINTTLLPSDYALTLENLKKQDPFFTRSSVFHLTEVESHPYFGYHNNYIDYSTPLALHSPYTNKLKTSADQFVVGFFGGSVAGEIKSHLDEGYFAERLRKIFPELKNRKIIFHVFAVGGMKQPQQFFISIMNMENLDLVINLDGYNEIESANYPYQKLEYPYLQKELMALGDDRYLDDRVFIKRLNGIKQVSLSLLKKKIFSHGQCLQVIAYSLDRWEIRKREEIRLRIERDSEDTGRKIYDRALGEKEILGFQTAIYKKFSLLQYENMKAHGIRSYFFLQPTLENNPRFMERYSVVKSMFAFQKKEKKPFFDMTDIFREKKGNYFIDECHLRSEGYKILFSSMLDKIEQDTKKAPF